MLRSLAVGTQWPQARLHQAGLAPSGLPHCRLCIWADGQGGKGTLPHRAWNCPATEAQRQHVPGMVMEVLYNVPPREEVVQEEQAVES